MKFLTIKYLLYTIKKNVDRRFFQENIEYGVVKGDLIKKKKKEILFSISSIQLSEIIDELAMHI